jgi:putative DNA primase/helicase
MSAQKIGRHAMVDIAYALIAASALPAITAILDRLNIRWQRQGNELAMLSPHRPDRHFGSFKANLRTGKWCDFAANMRGGDIVSLVAYLTGSKQSEAAHALAQMLGINYVA